MGATKPPGLQLVVLRVQVPQGYESYAITMAQYDKTFMTYQMKLAEQQEYGAQMSILYQMVIDMQQVTLNAIRSRK
jgi:hypothetical protein